MDEGIGPPKELWVRDRYVRCLTWPNDSGILPDRWLEFNDRDSNFWKFKILRGISPFKEVLLRSSLMRLVRRLEKQLGISWLKTFRERSRTRRDVKLTNPRDGFRLSSWQSTKYNSESDNYKFRITNLTITNLEPIGAWSTDNYLGTMG